MTPIQAGPIIVLPAISQFRSANMPVIQNIDGPNSLSGWFSRRLATVLPVTTPMSVPPSALASAMPPPASNDFIVAERRALGAEFRVHGLFAKALAVVADDENIMAGVVAHGGIGAAVYFVVLDPDRAGAPDADAIAIGAIAAGNIMDVLDDIVSNTRALVTPGLAGPDHDAIVAAVADMIAVYVDSEPVERVKAGALDMLDSILRENPAAAREIDAMARGIFDCAAANGKTRRVLEVEQSALGLDHIIAAVEDYRFERDAAGASGMEKWAGADEF